MAKNKEKKKAPAKAFYRLKSSPLCKCDLLVAWHNGREEVREALRAAKVNERYIDNVVHTMGEKDKYGKTREETAANDENFDYEDLYVHYGCASIVGRRNWNVLFCFFSPCNNRPGTWAHEANHAVSLLVREMWYTPSCYDNDEIHCRLLEGMVDFIEESYNEYVFTDIYKEHARILEERYAAVKDRQKKDDAKAEN